MSRSHEEEDQQCNVMYMYLNMLAIHFSIPPEEFSVHEDIGKSCFLV